MTEAKWLACTDPIPMLQSLQGKAGDRAAPPVRQRQPQPPQTAETCSSSATRKEEPQPQAATTFGLLTLKPAPCRLSS